MIKTLPLLLLMTLCCSAGFAQRTRMTGTVIEVLNGDTIIVNSSPDTKFTVKIQYVDAPEPNQPLYQAAKDHLAAFVLNKEIVFDVSVMESNVVRSRIYVDGADIGMQELRDGAAWFDPVSNTYQDTTEKSAYQSNETLAKNEKRGVWSIANLVPTYQLRAERQKRLQERMDKEWEAYMKAAAAMARYKTPNIGMHYYAFKSLCDAGSESGDSVSSLESADGTSVDVSLTTTKKRIENQCVGSFSFGTDFRLRTIYLSGNLKP